MFKWIFAVLGFAFAGIRGAFLGYLLGLLIDRFFPMQVRGGSNYRQGRPRRVSVGDFELNLLSLSAIVIKADGGISQRELDYVRAFFVQQFGKQRANRAFRTFNDIANNQKVEASRVSAYLRRRTTYEMRLQILHFLFGVANADGKILNPEIATLQRIASYLNINIHDFRSIKAMFVKSVDNSYKILEIEKDATEAEIKKAYRTMVKKYHPDKLVDMDEAYIKGAREKFNKVQEAYDKIRQERGF